MSAEQSLQRLAEALGRPVAEFRAFAALPPAQIERLAREVQLTHQRQQAALEAAITESLGHIPALLRGPVKKILGIS